MKFKNIKDLPPIGFGATKLEDGKWSLWHYHDSDDEYICKRGNVRRFDKLDVIASTIHRAGHENFTIEVYYGESDSSSEQSPVDGSNSES